MKKILVASIAIIGTLGMVSCERTNSSGDNETTLEDNKAVVDRDTIVTEYEVEETVVQYDTTTRTRTVDPDEENNNNDN